MNATAQPRNTSLADAIAYLERIPASRWTLPGDASFIDEDGRLCPVTRLAVLAGNRDGTFHDVFRVAHALGLSWEMVYALTLCYDIADTQEQGKRNVIRALEVLQTETSH